ncbi:MAG: NAD-dependent succinate-semialdehyde dehydrogenase [Pseudorhodobacter sp.]
MHSYPEICFYIGGQWRAGKRHAPVINPATEAEIGRVPLAETADLDDALTAAAEGFRVWSRTAPRERSAIILRAAALMRERIDEIATSITLEHGKPFSQARLEVIRGCEFFEWDAAEGQRLYGRVIPSAPGIRYSVIRQPTGIVAAFAPWNFPMSQPARKIAGALATGCSVIIKSAEETPAGTVHIARAFHDAGLPPGVLNIIFGVPDEISSYLIPKPEVRLVAFTGSTAVGRHLSEMAARAMTPVLMELGGHAPVVVCDDVDPVAAGTICADRKMRNAGQVCTSPTRFFVQDAIYDRYVEAFSKRARAVVVGDGFDPATEMGPLANHRRLEAMEAMIADARAHGARVVTGGDRVINRGYFMPVTVLTDVPDDAQVMSVEPFAPLAVIRRVFSVEEAIERANALPFGLAAYGMTHSAARAEQISMGLEAGNVSINVLEASVAEVPFGGVKDSGYGREGGAEGLDHYTVVKTISHQFALG